MTVVYDTTITPVVTGMLDCLTVEMGRTPVPPAVVCVRTGGRAVLAITETVDECCAGTAWVRLVRVYPSRSFPDPDDTADPCGSRRVAVELELGVARCSPDADPNNPPTCDDWVAASVTEYADVAALDRAVCCFASGNPDRLLVVGETVAQDSEGGCVMVTRLVTVSAIRCDDTCLDG